MSKYTSDQPITEPTNDEFNRAVFATDFIKIIDENTDVNYSMTGSSNTTGFKHLHFCDAYLGQKELKGLTAL